MKKLILSTLLCTSFCNIFANEELFNAIKSFNVEKVRSILKNGQAKQLDKLAGIELVNSMLESPQEYYNPTKDATKLTLGSAILAFAIRFAINNYKKNEYKLEAAGCKDFVTKVMPNYLEMFFKDGKPVDSKFLKPTAADGTALVNPIYNLNLILASGTVLALSALTAYKGGKNLLTFEKKQRKSALAIKALLREPNIESL